MDSSTSSRSSTVEEKTPAAEEKQPLPSGPPGEVSEDAGARGVDAAHPGLAAKGGGVDEGGALGSGSAHEGGGVSESGADGGMVGAGLVEKAGGLEGGENGTGFPSGKGVVSSGSAQKTGVVDGGEKVSSSVSGVWGEEGAVSFRSVDEGDVFHDAEKGRVLETGVSDRENVEVRPRVSVASYALEVAPGDTGLGSDENVPVAETGNPTTAVVTPSIPAEAVGVCGEVVNDSAEAGVVAQGENKDMEAVDAGEVAIYSKPKDSENVGEVAQGVTEVKAADNGEATIASEPVGLGETKDHETVDASEGAFSSEPERKLKASEDVGDVGQGATEVKVADTGEVASTKPVNPELTAVGKTVVKPTIEPVNSRNIYDADNIQIPVNEPVELNGGADDFAKSNASDGQPSSAATETTEHPASEVLYLDTGRHSTETVEVEITRTPAPEVVNLGGGDGDSDGDLTNKVETLKTEVETTTVPASVVVELAGGDGDKDLANKVETLNSGDGNFKVRDMPINKNKTTSLEEIDSLGEVQNRGMPKFPSVVDDGHAVSVSDDGGSFTASEKEKTGLNKDEEGKTPISDGHTKIAILGSSETAKQILKDLDGGFPSTSTRDFSPQIEGQIASDSDEEAETDEEGDGKELFDSSALSALLRAATGASSDGNVTITAPDAARIFSVDRPAGLGSSVPSLRPTAARPARSSHFGPSDVAVAGDPEMDEEEKKLHDKVEQIRVKFLRLVHRLGHSPEDTVAAQVLYRLGLAEGIKHGRQTSRVFSIERAKKKALQLEESGEENLEFSCNILVLGKSGVGKSETINSIFGERVANTNAFQRSTNCVQEISGIVGGVKVRFIDTPGLTPSVMDQSSNKRILFSIKKYTKKCPPDIVLYVDRLDTQTRDFNDLPLLRSITSTLGSSIWFNAIVALTHAASAPPDGPNGTTFGYDVFVAQRSHIVQHSIRQAAGDMRLMNPVALVENHPSCRRNREGQRVLPNGITWMPQLLLLCYSSKTLSEANSLLKLQDPSPGKLFGFRVRSPPLPYLLSSLLQSRPHPKLASDQGDGDSDIDLGDMSDYDKEEEEDEYDQLPPFKPLKKAQIKKLTKEQKKAYYDEYEYRVKLLQTKQLKEEIRRMKEIKKRGKEGQPSVDPGYGEMADDYDQDGAPAAVPVPLPDMALPPTFDCENPAYRYRFLEPTSQLLARPVLDTHGWDHDCGYDGVSLEDNLALAGRFPGSIAVQITKDKKDFNIHMDSSIAAKLGENGSSLAGLDIQSVGKQLAYILKSETKFKNLKKNKTAAGISVTFLGENVATGLKIEDQILIGNRMSLAASTGAIRSRSDTAYGANLEAKLREKDYPIGQEISTLGLSLMKWRGDLALGANLQSQLSVGRNSKVAVRVGLNNKLSGQISVKTSTSEQLQIALLGILPIAVSIFRSVFPGELVQ